MSWEGSLASQFTLVSSLLTFQSKLIVTGHEFGRSLRWPMGSCYLFSAAGLLFNLTQPLLNLSSNKSQYDKQFRNIRRLRVSALAVIRSQSRIQNTPGALPLIEKPADSGYEIVYRPDFRRLTESRTRAHEAVGNRANRFLHSSHVGSQKQ